MLVHLHVKNLALIEEAEVDFEEGLNILTGETGAGKSILIGSVNLALGQKMSREMIREGADYAYVELVFQVNPDTEEKLKKLEVFPEEGQVIISRRFTENRSISKINGETTTVSGIRKISELLLDIHGQHEHQSLLYRDKQLEILDSYGRAQIFPQKTLVEEAYRQYRKSLEELNSLDIDEEQRNREMAFLEFEVTEIENAALTAGEDEELEHQYKKLSNARKIMEVLQTVHTITGYENGAGDMTGTALREMAKVTQYDEELESLSQTLNEADSLLNDFHRELSSYLDDLVFDEETFYQVERRLDLINNLKAKYGQEISGILSYRDKQIEKLEKLRKYEEYFQAAKEKVQKAEEKLEEASYELSKIRQEYKEQLEKKVVQGLKDLNFLDVDFAIRFDRRKNYTQNGFDDVEYEISTNPGEMRKPLGQIVSGGELSRIMLALKAILADRDEIETLIFDEIDTGISGRTAQKVSEKMAVIGKHHQVLCITHLPQIAAMADTHFEIEKHVKGSETTTQIHPLNEEDSVRELARLLGGAEITAAVLENAKEMKELAQVHKNTRLK